MNVRIFYDNIEIPSKNQTKLQKSVSISGNSLNLSKNNTEFSTMCYSKFGTLNVYQEDESAQKIHMSQFSPKKCLDINDKIKSNKITIKNYKIKSKLNERNEKLSPSHLNFRIESRLNTEKSSGAKVRYDAKGNKIVKGSTSHKVTFADKIDFGKRRLIENVDILSYKSYVYKNTYSESFSDEKKGRKERTNCCIVF